MDWNRFVVVIAQAMVMAGLVACVVTGHDSATIATLMGVIGGSLAGTSVITTIQTLKKGDKLAQ